jgi:hypothetical protein
MERVAGRAGIERFQAHLYSAGGKSSVMKKNPQAATSVITARV